MTPSLRGGGQVCAYLDNELRPLAGLSSSLALGRILVSRVGRCRETSCYVARTTGVSVLCPSVLCTDNYKVPICRHFIQAL